jgi:xanthine dehydrogenase small subunit
MATPKEYHRPRTLEQALLLLHRPASVPLAGGALTLDSLDVPYEAVVDLQAIPELTRVEITSDTVILGGAAPLAAVYALPNLPIACRGALSRAVTLQQRNAISVAESILHPAALPEWNAALFALGATVTVALLHGEVLSLSLDEFWAEPPRGIIREVLLPRLTTREALAAAQIARTPADQPIVSATVYVLWGVDGHLADAHAAVTGASPEGVRRVGLTTLLGHELTEATIHGVLPIIASQLHPPSDYRGSAEYRAEMTVLCIKRALLDCLNLAVAGNLGV